MTLVQEVHAAYGRGHTLGCCQLSHAMALDAFRLWRQMHCKQVSSGLLAVFSGCTSHVPRF